MNFVKFLFQFLCGDKFQGDLRIVSHFNYDQGATGGQGKDARDGWIVIWRLQQSRLGGIELLSQA